MACSSHKPLTSSYSPITKRLQAGQDQGSRTVYPAKYYFESFPLYIQSKLLESHTLHSGTYLYSPYKAVLPPLPPEEPLDSRTKTAMRARFDFSRTMETLVSGHPRDANRVSVALAGRLRECKSTEFVWKFRKTASTTVRECLL